MDGADWTLVPHHSLIAAILAWVTKVTVHDVTGYNENKRFPISQVRSRPSQRPFKALIDSLQLYNQQTEFQYFFLALTEEMKDVAIHRYATDVESDFDPKAFETHFHPFDTIGALTSHIQPHFVVFSAGQKLAEIASSKTADDFDDFVGNLALTTSFGHEGEPAEVIEANIHSLEDIISIHKAWSSSIHVPKLTDTPRSSWMVRPEGCEETVKVKK
jgi:hypothetical protein